jgi:hypothetical protein
MLNIVTNNKIVKHSDHGFKKMHTVFQIRLSCFLYHLLLFLSFLLSPLTKCIRQSPSWEDCSHSTVQTIPRLLCDSKFHYIVHNSLPVISLLNQLTLVHILASCFFKICSYIILLYTPRCPTEVLSAYISHACYVPR